MLNIVSSIKLSHKLTSTSAVLNSLYMSLSLRHLCQWLFLSALPVSPAAVIAVAPGTCYNSNIYFFLLRKAFFIIKTSHLSSWSPS